jgi:hypothetical protein
VRFQGPTPVNAAEIVAEPPLQIVVLPLAAEVGRGLTVTDLLSAGAAELHIPRVMLTAYVGLPLGGVSLIDCVFPPNGDPSLVQLYVTVPPLGLTLAVRLIVVPEQIGPLGAPLIVAVGTRSKLISIESNSPQRPEMGLVSVNFTLADAMSAALGM